VRACRITVDEAREYFSHPSQQKGAQITPDALPGDPFEYWACGGVCVVFHVALWPGIWMVHCGVKPEVWGRAVEPAREILSAFREARDPAQIIGWTEASNRAAVSFALRVGFRETGKMTMPDGAIVMTEYMTCQ
jgi:hypothetical protein